MAHLAAQKPRAAKMTVLEANGRAAGRVKTLSDPLADGLYADVGLS
jgi:hypothetical protein